MKIKKLIVLLSLLAFTLLTGACSNESSTVSNKVSSTTTTSVEVVQKDYRSFYKPVFDDYEKILSTSKDTSAIMNLYESLKVTKRPINSWALETAVFQADKMRYAYLDLNEDGVEELLVGVDQLDGSYFLTGLYYLENEKPVLLAEGFVAGHGGARNAMNIYQGGDILELSWSSGNGDGIGVLYRLNSNQKVASKIQEKEVRIPGNNNLHDTFGKASSELMEFSQLDWQEFPTSKSVSEQKAPWTSEKSAKLELFIKGWGERLGQPNYKKGIAGGDVGPDNLYTFGDGPSEKMNAEYSDTGLGTAQYRIVERYSNWDKFPDVHSYYFAITNTGEAIVFHSPTTNGGVMYLRPTENTEIQAEFKRLVESD